MYFSSQSTVCVIGDRLQDEVDLSGRECTADDSPTFQQVPVVLTLRRQSSSCLITHYLSLVHFS